MHLRCKPFIYWLFRRFYGRIPIVAQKRQAKIHRKYEKKVIEPKIKKALEDQGL